MSIELTILISVLSFSFAVYSGIVNMKRNAKKDTTEDIAQLTTIIVRLDTINNGVSEIKTEMKSMKNEVQELRERVVVVEQSTKSAHHRIDGLGGASE